VSRAISRHPLGEWLVYHHSKNPRFLGPGITKNVPARFPKEAPLVLNTDCSGYKGASKLGDCSKSTGSQFESFIGLLPGANELMVSSAGTGTTGGGGLLSGLIGAAGDLIGDQSAEAAKAVSALEQAG
jgi:hypothetical protein